MRRRGRSLAVALLCVLGACEFGEHPVAPTGARPVVHAVLNPFVATYTVLVEELLTGRVDVDSDLPFVEVDPIRSGSGVPINDARVMIYDEFGDSARGTEDVLATGGTGVYRFTNAFNPSNGSSLPLSPGVRYTLRITTPDGVIVTGSTLIPEGVDTAGFVFMGFNKDTDTLRLSWPAVPGAKSYLLRVNTPRGPYHIFTDSLDIRLPGSLRDFFNDGLPSVFVAGFSQTLQLSAIDTNFYDYYRSQNNPFTGTGLINHLQGGTGLFGSLVPLKALSLETVATQDLPVEGRFEGNPSFASSAPAVMTLYVDSRWGKLAQITGNYEREALPGRRGVIGFLNGSSISLAFLREQLASDTSETFSGTLFGSDSIVGTSRATGERIVYRKVP